MAVSVRIASVPRRARIRSSYRRPLLRRRGLRGQVSPRVLLGLVVLALAIIGAGGDVIPALQPAAPAVTSCAPGQGVAGFSGDQLANAATIVAVGREMGVPPRGQLVAIATAMQESKLFNLDYGDRDSLGLFQQRPSMGWGSPAQVRDPRYAARKFYDGLLKVPGWERLPVTVAAQAVQRSGFPAAYAKWEGPANQVVAATTCT